MRSRPAGCCSAPIFCGANVRQALHEQVSGLGIGLDVHQIARPRDGHASQRPPTPSTRSLHRGSCCVAWCRAQPPSAALRRRASCSNCPAAASRSPGAPPARHRARPRPRRRRSARRAWSYLACRRAPRRKPSGSLPGAASRTARPRRRARPRPARPGFAPRPAASAALGRTTIRPSQRGPPPGRSRRTAAGASRVVPVLLHRRVPYSRSAGLLNSGVSAMAPWPFCGKLAAIGLIGCRVDGVSSRREQHQRLQKVDDEALRRRAQRANAIARPLRLTAVTEDDVLERLLRPSWP